MTLIFCSRINSKGCSKHIMSMALYLRNFGWRATGLNLIDLSIFFFRLTHVIGMDTISSCTMISGMQARALSHSSIGMYFFQNFFIILLCLVENSNCWGKKNLRDANVMFCLACTTCLMITTHFSFPWKRNYRYAIFSSSCGRFSRPPKRSTWDQSIYY